VNQTTTKLNATKLNATKLNATEMQDILIGLDKKRKPVKFLNASLFIEDA
jgi:hypothetical protein